MQDYSLKKGVVYCFVKLKRHVIVLKVSIM